MLKCQILILSFLLMVPACAFSSKTEIVQNKPPQLKIQNTEYLLKEIREISVSYSASTSKLLNYKKELERLELTTKNVEELFYLREVVYAISVITVSAAYQKLMLYQYPDIESENNIHTTTLIMSLRSTKEQLLEFYSKLKMAQRKHIKNNEFNEILEKCLAELYFIGDLTKRSLEIIDTIDSN